MLGSAGATGTRAPEPCSACAVRLEAGAIAGLLLAAVEDGALEASPAVVGGLVTLARLARPIKH